MVSTLDVLSGGRAYLGIGAGWYKREAHGLGLPLPDVKERFERLEETLQIANHMWSGQRTALSGTILPTAGTNQLSAAFTATPSAYLDWWRRREKDLRLVAQYGDACNLYAGGDTNEYAEGIESIRSKLAVLQRHCDMIGRPYDDIERTALAGVNLTQTSTAVSDATRLCESLAELGVRTCDLQYTQCA